MQNRIAVFALAGLLALSAGAARAQEAPASAAAPSQPQPQAPRMAPERQLKHLTRVLNLSADQQNQIRPLLVERQQKLQALAADTTLAPKDRHAQVRGINETAQSGITAALNDDQKQKYAQMREEMKERKGRHGHAGEAPQAQPAPQS